MALKKIVELTEPVTLCARCREPESRCEAAKTGSHIYDGLAHPYAVADSTGRVVSHHLSRSDATRVVR